MSDVEFEETGLGPQSSFGSRSILGEPRIPSAFTILKKVPGIKTDAQAYYALLAVLFLCIAITAFVIYFFIIGPGPGKVIVITPENQALLRP